jgi:uncharacterized protein YqgC (DUF456 family)
MDTIVGRYDVGGGSVHDWRMEGNVWMWVVAVLLVVVGVAGSVLPALPGVPLVFTGLVVAAWADDFQRVGWITLTLLGVLTLASFAIDFAATALGAKRVGATRYAIIGAALGTLGGLFLGIPGLLIGPFAGAFAGAVAGEMLSHGEWRRATHAGVATWLGLLFGTLTKVALVFAMLGIFVFAYLVG